MIKLKQLISYILVIQLCVSCTGSGGGSSPAPLNPSSTSGGTSGGSSGSDSSGGGTVTIEGQISKVFRGVSDFVLSSAVAQEGEITVFDMTKPDEPIIPINLKIEDGRYSLELPADQAVGTILKLKYVGPVGERDLLINIDDVGSPIDGEMNEEKHFEAGILEDQLKQELGDFSEKKEEFRQRFKKLKESGVSEDLAIFGDSESMKEILKDGDNGPDMKKLIIESRRAREEENSEHESEIVAKMIDLAKRLFGESYSSKRQLSCLENRAKFFIDGEKKYSFSFIGNELEVLRAFGGMADFGVASTSEEANRILRDMTLKLQGISKVNKDKNLSGVVTISDVSGGEEIDSDKTCTLKAFKGEIEEPDYFYNLKLIQDVQFSDAANQDDFRKKLIEAFEMSFEEYQKNLSKKISEEEEIFELVLKQADRKANELIEKRIEDYIEATSDVVDISLMKNIDFEILTSYDEGRQLLREALLKTLEEVNSKAAAPAAPLPEEKTLTEEAAKMKEAFLDVEATLRESLTPEELAQKYYVERMDALREYFNQRYEAQFGFDFKPESLDLQGLVYLDGYNQMKAGIETAFNDLNLKIKDKNLEPVAAKEALFFRMRALMKVVESRLVDFQGYLHEEQDLTYMLDRSQIYNVNYHGFSTSGEAMNQAEVERESAMNALRDKMTSEEDFKLIQPEQKLLSELTLIVKRMEIDVCYSGEGESLLSVCQKDQRLMAESAKRREASEITRAISE